MLNGDPTAPSPATPLDEAVLAPLQADKVSLTPRSIYPGAATPHSPHITPPTPPFPAPVLAEDSP